MTDKRYMWMTSLAVSLLLFFLYYIIIDYLEVNNSLLQISLIISMLFFFLLAIYLSANIRGEAVQSVTSPLDEFASKNNFVKIKPEFDNAYWGHLTYSGKYRNYEFKLSLLSVRYLGRAQHIADYSGEEVFVLVEGLWKFGQPRFEIPQNIYIEENFIRCYIRGSELTENKIIETLGKISSILDNAK